MQTYEPLWGKTRKLRRPQASVPTNRGRYLDFDLSEEQLMLRDLVERYVGSRYDPAKRLSYVRDERGFSAEGWQLLAETGLLAFPFAEEMGGLGGGAVALITVMEALGRGVVTEPVLPSVVLGGCLLAHAGTAEQKAEWLPRLIGGEAFPALAHIERTARFGLTSIATRAAAGNGAARLSGSKQLALGGGFADIFLISAIDEAGAPGLYLVHKDAPGLVRRDYRLTDGSVASDLVLDDVEAEAMAGGMEALDQTLADARLAICAELVGLSALMFDATLDYVKTRNQFGQTLGKFQVIQHRMAENYARLELSRSQLYRAAGNAMDWAALAAAKSFISANAMALGEDSIQLHGGIGTTEELMVGQAFKRVLLLTSFLGDAEWELRRYNALRESGGPMAVAAEAG